MLSSALSASVDMFKENARVITIIEDKAQKAATLAGIFLAAAFAFLRKEPLQDLFGLEEWIGVIMLSVAIALMLGCVLVCAYTLYARRMLTPPAAADILRKTELRLRAEPERQTDEMRENHIREQANAWHDALIAQESAIAIKSKLLMWTQGLLVVGISVVAALLILSAFAYGTRTQQRNKTSSISITRKNSRWQDVSNPTAAAPQLPAVISAPPINLRESQSST
jgi:hypothetical protein